MRFLGFGKKVESRVLACRDTGMDCAAVFKGRTDDEVLKQAAEHAERDHQMKPTPEMAARLRRLIKNA